MSRRKGSEDGELGIGRMVTEIVELNIKPGDEAAFEKSVAQAAGLFKKTKGCLALCLRRSVEQPTRYRLFVRWRHIDDHLVGFKNSPEIDEWRRLVGPFFASVPAIEHFEEVFEGFGGV